MHGNAEAKSLIFSRWVYTRGYAMDGNFSAEHMKMRRPENDVALSDGRQFMVSEKRYKRHLNVAVESKTVGYRLGRSGRTY